MDGKWIEVFKQAKEIVIAAHVSPDGDAIGSSFAAGLILSKFGKQVKIVLEPYTDRYNILDGKELIYDGDWS